MILVEKKSTWKKNHGRKFNEGIIYQIIRDLVWLFGVRDGWEWFPSLGLKEKESKEQLLKFEIPGPVAMTSNRTCIL